MSAEQRRQAVDWVGERVRHSTPPPKALHENKCARAASFLFRTQRSPAQRASAPVAASVVVCPLGHGVVVEAIEKSLRQAHDLRARVLAA